MHLDVPKYVRGRSNSIDPSTGTTSGNKGKGRNDWLMALRTDGEIWARSGGGGVVYNSGGKPKRMTRGV
jgi:hypothetical protein